MWKRFLLSLLWAGIIVADIPDCDYFDTVDLTDSKKFVNGSYLYEKLVIPPELTGEYNYEILLDGERVDVTNHLRGCACKLGNCVRFCCHKNLVLVEDERKCSGDISKAADFDPYVNITLYNGTQVVKHILDDFIVQRHLPVPCSAHFHLDAKHNEDDAWTLFENGSLSMTNNDYIMYKGAYCLQPHPIGDEDGVTQLRLVPHLCNDTDPTSKNDWINNILRILSIICLIVTVFVYLWIPKLRTLQGLCFVCYMICLIVALTMLLADFIRLVLSSIPPEWICVGWGYLGYFATISAFIWLTIISYDLWTNFRGNSYNINRQSPRNRFIMYNIFTWSFAVILTVIVIIVDNIADRGELDDLTWLPGFAVYNCWIKTDDWSAMIYFYGPISIFLLFNITMFVLTIIRIIGLQKYLQNIANREQSESKLSSDKHTFVTFLRLFVIMGVAWTFEILGYLGQNNEIWSKAFVVFDYINNGQGIVIFILFVLKPSVMKLIMNRAKGIESPTNDYGYEEEVALQERNGAANKFGPSILN